MLREQLRQSLDDDPADIGEILVLLLLILLPGTAERSVV